MDLTELRSGPTGVRGPDLQAPHTAAVVQSRVELPDGPRLLDVPHVQAVVAVHAGEPLPSGVKGQGQHVGVLGPGAGGQRAEREQRGVRLE